MSYSSLCNSVIETDKHYSFRGSNICKITPHHMAGVNTGQGCAAYFRDTARLASANYCIGVDGDISGCVDEDFGAWTSSSEWNDDQAITIEVSDCDENFNISDASWNALVNLCADICRRFGFDLNYTGDANGSLTVHRMFSPTQCPGDSLYDRMPELAEAVNKLLHKGVDPEAYGVFRMYNPNAGDHHYTADLSEANDLVAKGWSYEGIAFHHAGDAGVPCYRIYNTVNGFHHQTINKDEYESLKALGWKDEGVAYNVYTEGTPVYRLYNPNGGQHFFTESEAERDHVVEAGWNLEGIAWYTKD